MNDRPSRPASSTRRAIRRPQFRRLFTAQTVSRWGDTFNAVALVIEVFQLTGSGAKVSVAVVLEIAPVLAFGFIAGGIVDRLPRQRVMIGADLARAAIAAGVAAEPHHLWTLYPAAFGLSAFTVFFNPAAASVLPSLVDEDELVGANSALWSAAVLSQMVLAPLAGLLVTTVGASAAFAINAGSFLFSAATLAGLHIPLRPVTPTRSHWAEAVEGARLIRANRFLATLASVQLLAAMSAGATSALLVVLAERHLHTHATGFGFLLAAIGVGAGLSPLVLQRFVRDVRRPVLQFGPYLLRGVVDLVLATFTSLAVAVVALIGYGVATSTGNVAYTTALQTIVPDRIRGRIFASYDVIWQTGRLISIGIGGVLADLLGISAVYYLGGALLLVAGALGHGLVRTKHMTRPIVINEEDT